MATKCAPVGITLTIQPLRTEGKLLLPIGRSFEIVSDYLNSRRAIVEESRERNWSVHVRSVALARRVSAETPPKAVVKSEGGVLLGVWIGGVA